MTSGFELVPTEQWSKLRDSSTSQKLAVFATGLTFGIVNARRLLQCHGSSSSDCPAALSSFIDCIVNNQSRLNTDQEVQQLNDMARVRNLFVLMNSKLLLLFIKEAFQYPDHVLMSYECSFYQTVLENYMSDETEVKYATDILNYVFSVPQPGHKLKLGSAVVQLPTADLGIY